MTANERREEIMRILVCRRMESMRLLAHELGVSTRTIRNDITVLTVDYPLYTTRGKSGGVALESWYQPNKIILTQKHQSVLIQLMAKADEAEESALREILSTYGSPAVRKQLAAHSSLNGK